MWEKLLAFTASFVQIGSLLLENQKQIKDLHQQVEELNAGMKLMAQDLKHFTEMERAHHRNNLLELENRLLQMEKRLAPKNEDKAE